MRVAGVALVVLGYERLAHAGRTDMTALENQCEFAALRAPMTDRRDSRPNDWLTDRELHDDSPGMILALCSPRRYRTVLMRFNESIGVRLWGRELHNFRAGEVYDVSTAVAAVLLAQGCAEPVSQPPAIPDRRVA